MSPCASSGDGKTENVGTATLHTNPVAHCGRQWLPEADGFANLLYFAEPSGLGCEANPELFLRGQAAFEGAAVVNIPGCHSFRPEDLGQASLLR